LEERGQEGRGKEGQERRVGGMEGRERREGKERGRGRPYNGNSWICT